MKGSHFIYMDTDVVQIGAELNSFKLLLLKKHKQLVVIYRDEA